MRNWAFDNPPIDLLTSFRGSYRKPLCWKNSPPPGAETELNKYLGVAEFAYGRIAGAA
jgi:hypothetical protein